MASKTKNQFSLVRVAAMDRRGAKSKFQFRSVLVLAPLRWEVGQLEKSNPNQGPGGIGVRRSGVPFALAVALWASCGAGGAILVPPGLISEPKQGFSLKTEVTGSRKTLQTWTEEYDPASLRILVTGVDWSRPARPYTFDWGDGTKTEGEWPQTHVYKSKANYLVKVTSHHPSLGPATNTLPIRFAPSQFRKAALPAELRVEFARQPTLIQRPDGSSQQMDCFGDRFFAVMHRDDMEYVLQAAACIQFDLLNADILTSDGSFRQVIFREAGRGGMDSHWDWTPPSFVAGDYAFRPPMAYSDFFHEMGHNFNLNSPKAFRYGGNATGATSSIYTETLAQILQYATACAIINHQGYLGLDEFTVLEVRAKAIDHIRILRRHSEQWVAAGMHYRSWDDAPGHHDDVTGTFMTLAYKFIQHAEAAGKDRRAQVKRMMSLLQCFNEDWRARYGQRENSPAAESFRATLMVAAISYGLLEDLRDEFKALRYPIDDTVYLELVQAAAKKRVATP